MSAGPSANTNWRRASAPRNPGKVPSPRSSPPAVVGTLYLQRFIPSVPLWHAIALTVAANIAGQLGDLAESAMKRGAERQRQRRHPARPRRLPRPRGQHPLRSPRSLRIPQARITREPLLPHPSHKPQSVHQSQSHPPTRKPQSEPRASGSVVRSYAKRRPTPNHSANLCLHL